jgi:hypothetical protein
VPTLRQALREATPVPVSERMIADCINPKSPADRLFARTRRRGLAATPLSERRGLARVTGEVAESLAEILLAEVGLDVFWHIVEDGIHGVDLLFLTPDESVLALEVKGTLRPGTIPRLTPSRLRQMSREWLNRPDNPAMAEWELEADDLYAGVMVVDLASSIARTAVSGDFEDYVPVSDLTELRGMKALVQKPAGQFADGRVLSMSEYKASGGTSRLFEVRSGEELRIKVHKEDYAVLWPTELTDSELSIRLRELLPTTDLRVVAHAEDADSHRSYDLSGQERLALLTRMLSDLGSVDFVRIDYDDRVLTWERRNDHHERPNEIGFLAETFDPAYLVELVRSTATREVAAIAEGAIYESTDIVGRFPTQSLYPRPSPDLPNQSSFSH